MGPDGSQTVGGRTAIGQFVAERVAMAVPYILVNNPMSYAGGREIYGYPKTLGIFDPTSAIGDPQTVEAFGGDFSATSEARWRPLFELSRTGAGQQTGGTEPRWQQIEEVLEQMPGAWGDIAGGLSEVSVLESILKALVGEQSPQVFLKQFRDVRTRARTRPRTRPRYLMLHCNEESFWTAPSPIPQEVDRRVLAGEAHSRDASLTPAFSGGCRSTTAGQD